MACHRWSRKRCKRRAAPSARDVMSVPSPPPLMWACSLLHLGNSAKHPLWPLNGIKVHPSPVPSPSLWPHTPALVGCLPVQYVLAVIKLWVSYSGSEGYIIDRPVCFTSTEARMLIRDGNKRVGVGRGAGDERVNARPRIPPEKDRRDRGPPPEQWKC